MAIINDGNEYRLPDFFLNDDVQFSYQIEKPSLLSGNDYLISAEISPNFWWEHSSENDWLSITNDGVLSGIPYDFGESRRQNYDLTLEYSSGATIFDNFTVIVNPHVHADIFGKDFYYRLNYNVDLYNSFDIQFTSSHILFSTSIASVIDW